MPDARNGKMVRIDSGLLWSFVRSKNRYEIITRILENKLADLGVDVSDILALTKDEAAHYLTAQHKERKQNESLANTFDGT